MKSIGTGTLKQCCSTFILNDLPEAVHSSRINPFFLGFFRLQLQAAMCGVRWIGGANLDDARNEDLNPSSKGCNWRVCQRVQSRPHSKGWTTNLNGNLFDGACLVIDSYFDMIIIEVPLILKVSETWRSLKLRKWWTLTDAKVIVVWVAVELEAVAKMMTINEQ